MISPVTDIAITRRSWVLHERSRRHYWQGAGQLSVKMFFGGRAHYRVGCGRYAVDDTCYLVLNQGQTYTVEIDLPEPIESFCLFFAPGLVEKALHSLSNTTERLLDSPQDTTPVEFFQKTNAQDAILSPALSRLRARHSEGSADAAWLEAEFHTLAERLLVAHEAVRRETTRLDSLRAATREELYRRVRRARDYARALFAEAITVTKLAEVACLSPNHLLRPFQQAFGLTPHRFLTVVRLGEAKKLLADTEISITQICLAVGFESPGSFSTLFRRTFGKPPLSFRHQCQLQRQGYKKVILKKRAGHELCKLSTK